MRCRADRGQGCLEHRCTPPEARPGSPPAGVGYRPKFISALIQVPGTPHRYRRSHTAPPPLLSHWLCGGRTELAVCPVNIGTGEKIESWTRAHSSFRGNVPERAKASVSASIADELVKLAQLRDTGVLSSDEFDGLKAKLLNST
jgi:hypothetical protein